MRRLIDSGVDWAAMKTKTTMFVGRQRITFHAPMTTTEQHAAASAAVLPRVNTQPSLQSLYLSSSVIKSLSADADYFAAKNIPERS